MKSPGTPSFARDSREFVTPEVPLGRTPDYRTLKRATRPAARGRAAESRSSTLIAFNKPYGVLCQFSGDAHRATLADYIDVPDVYPAGRLDADSEGLVLLTDDGAMQAAIAHPRHKLPKRYWVQVEGTPTTTALEALRRGVTLSDGATRPAQARVIEPPPTLWPRDPPVRFRRAIPTTWLDIAITEGRNRQVRRMTAAVGLPTLRLVRHAIGPWSLQGLRPGEWRHEPDTARVQSPIVHHDAAESPKARRGRVL
jgi:23S rRNA pseudouridine2457 synthase